MENSMLYYSIRQLFVFYINYYMYFVFEKNNFKLACDKFTGRFQRFFKI